MNKTAIEILEINGVDNYSGQNRIIKSMQEYSNQQNATLKAENEELVIKKEEIIEGLKKLSNEYFVSEGHYVISKYNLENFIEFFTT